MEHATEGRDAEVRFEVLVVVPGQSGDPITRLERELLRAEIVLAGKRTAESRLVRRRLQQERNLQLATARNGPQPHAAEPEAGTQGWGAADVLQ